MKFFVLMLLAIFIMPANAEDIYSQPTDEVNIDKIEYNYTFSDGYLTCKGDLEVILNVSNRCDKLFLYYSKPFIANIDDFKTFIAIYEFTQFEPGSKNSLVIPNMKWGTYFKVRELLDDGTNIYSTTYCTNSYIDERDLKIILEQASVDRTIADTTNISLENGKLSIETTETVDINIADLNGNLIFSGIVSQPTSVNIDRSTTPIIICRYQINNSIISKKFIVK